MPVVRPLIPLLLLLPACSWVGKTAFEERLGEVDDDGDGVAAATDCDDNNAAISPAIEETWYDGIDNDCAGDDDYDQDGDGFVPDEHLGLETADIPESGAFPGGDCNDTIPTVSPRQPDTFYDGVDQDCDGADDYDQDVDGYVADEYAGLVTENAEGTGALPVGDCDDLVATVNPSSQDAWYDGVDTDCGGEDDWDADGDGFVPFDYYDDYGPTTYVTLSGNLPNGDCDDDDATIHVGATDTWYDDIDSDCREDDDFDQDLDGYQDVRNGGEDCDDLDAAAFPGGMEHLGDAQDSDCDGGVDSFALSAVPGYTWEGPHDPIFVASSTRVYLSIAGTETFTGSETYYDSALALYWSATSPSDGISSYVAWSANTRDPSSYDLGAGQAFIAGDTYLYGALGLDNDTARSLLMVRYTLSARVAASVSAQSTDDWALMEDVSLVQDSDGTLHAVGCDATDGVLAYMKVSDIGSGSGIADTNEEGLSIWSSACVLDIRDGVAQVFTSEGGTIVSYAFDPTAADVEFVATPVSDAYAPLDLDIPSDRTNRTLVFADDTSDSIVSLDEDLTPTVIAEGFGALDVDSHLGDDGDEYIGFVTPDGGAWLARGNASDGYTYTELGVSFSVESIAVWTEGDSLLVGVTGGDDVAVGVAETI